MSKEFTDLIKQHNITTEDLAEETGTKFSTVASWRATSRPTPPIALAYLNQKQKHQEKVVTLARIILKQHRHDSEGNRINCSCQDCKAANQAIYEVINNDK